MKKLFLFATLCVFAFGTKAQDMNFEETVKYIKNKVVNDNSYYLDKSGWSYAYVIINLEPTKSGDITFTLGSGPKTKLNLFELKHGNEEGIIVLNQRIYLYTSKTDYYTIDHIQSNAEAERISKALIHLRSLCTKEKDPFDN